MPSRRPAGGSPAQRCFDSYTVVQFTDLRGHIRFEVLDSKLYKLREKALREAHAEAVEAWEKARKDDPSLPRPSEPAVEIVKCGISGADARGRANAIALRCKQRLEMKQREETKAEASEKPPEG